MHITYRSPPISSRLRGCQRIRNNCANINLEPKLSMPFPLNVRYFFNFSIPIFDIFATGQKTQFDCFSKNFWVENINYLWVIYFWVCRTGSKSFFLMTHRRSIRISIQSKFQEIQRWHRNKINRLIFKDKTSTYGAISKTLVAGSILTNHDRSTGKFPVEVSCLNPMAQLI